MAIVNPPWRYDQALEAWLPALAERLAQERAGSWRVEFLKRN
jgi:23S rRNA (adenine2030-N6)-methyltransferase